MTSKRAGRRAPAPRKAAWRRTVDRWGGLPVLGSAAVALVVVGALIYLNRPAGEDPLVVTSTAQAPVAGRIHGNPDAPVKVIEFADFQCPFCKRWVVDTGPLLAEEFIKSGQVQLEYRYYAFLGEESKKAAEAAECASDQGRFWEMHDVLYSHQGRENSGVYTSANLKKYATEVAAKVSGFDTARFDACLDGGSKRAVVDQVTAQAAEIGVRSTPSFLVTGPGGSQAITGAQPIDVFRAAIAAAKTPRP